MFSQQQSRSCGGRVVVVVVYLAEALAQDGSALAVGHAREGGDARREEEQEHRRPMAVLLLVRRRPGVQHQRIRSPDYNSERVNGGTSSTAQTPGGIVRLTAAG